MQMIVEKCDEADISYLDEFLDFKNLEVVQEDTSIPADYPGLILRADSRGLSLRLGADSLTLPTSVDFLSHRLHHRINTSRRSQGLPKAVGLDKTRDSITVLDVTSGLGIDAWSLAAFGCRVHMVEKSGVMAALLFDGIKRANSEGNAEERAILEHITLTHADAHDFLSALNESPDVITLDPMFPPRSKSAKVKKDMALMQQFLPVNDDLESLLALAIQKAGKRVVLKRPGKSEKNPDPKPDFQVPGKACHFQVYLTG